jgi:hypothetical protein
MFRLIRFNPSLSSSSLQRATTSLFAPIAKATQTTNTNKIITSSTPLCSSSIRFCSTTENNNTTASSSSTTTATTTTTSTTSSEVEQLEQILEEVTMLLDEPLPIGTLFKALSAESRNYISSKRLSFESFLLRYPQKFQVFKPNVSYDRNIYVCKAGGAPVNANHAQEVAGTTVGAHAIHSGGVTDGARARIYTVLKYVPNEWASYVALPIPDDVKRKIIKKPAKQFFERNPRYFEVRFNPNVGHTFEIRRSSQLQEFMKQKTQMGGGK